MSSVAYDSFSKDFAAVCIIGVSVIAGCPQGESRLSFVFAGDLAAVRIIGVSVIAGCPQGEKVDCNLFLPGI